MPIQVEIIPLERLVVAVGRGTVTLEEYQDFLVQVMQAKVMHYRKLIDITMAINSVLKRDQIMTMEARLASFAGKFPRGALAIVIDSSHAENAAMFKELASKDRPVGIFSSIHDARKWLREQPVSEPKPG